MLNYRPILKDESSNAIPTAIALEQKSAVNLTVVNFGWSDNLCSAGS
jgi:hypothetical protein